MKTKKSIQLLLIALLSVVSTQAFAYDIAVENEDGVTIYYNYINGGSELEVTYACEDPFFSYNYYYSGNVVIPEEVLYNGSTLKVTSIEDNAFLGCCGLTSLTIPKSVKSIGNSAFASCEYLTSIYISDLEAWCKISFGTNPISYSYKLYLNGEEIKNLVIPNTITSISDYAFVRCSNLISVTIPNGVTSIGNGAFRDCSNLTSINIPSGITYIGKLAFCGCSNLTSIPIPESVTAIGDYAFYSCRSLTSIIIPDGVTSIGAHTFQNCSSLTSVTIPNSVTNIGEFAFSECYGLTSITIA